MSFKSGQINAQNNKTKDRGKIIENKKCEYLSY